MTTSTAPGRDPAAAAGDLEPVAVPPRTREVLRFLTAASSRSRCNAIPAACRHSRPSTSGGSRQGNEVRSMRTGLVQQDARDDFDRARRRANWAKMAGWLLGRSASRNRLAELGEIASAPARTGQAGGWSMNGSAASDQLVRRWCPSARLSARWSRRGTLTASSGRLPITCGRGFSESPSRSDPAAGWTPSSSTDAAVPTTCSTGATASPWLVRLASARCGRLSPRFG